MHEQILVLHAFKAMQIESSLRFWFEHLIWIAIRENNFFEILCYHDRVLRVSMDGLTEQQFIHYRVFSRCCPGGTLKQGSHTYKR